MKLNRVVIEKYRVLERNIINFNDFQLFPRGSQIVGLIGANGSGKTTFCSTIAKVFQAIVTRSKLGFNIEIEFEFNSIKSILKCYNNHVWLIVNKELFYDFVLGSRLSREEKIRHNKKIQEFWDGKIILSTFETCGEYPSEKPANFVGDDPITKFDVASIYGKNIFGYPSITKGIIRFLENTDKQMIANSFLQRMGLSFSGEIDLKIVHSVADFAPIYDDDNRDESILYKKLENDSRIILTSKPQILSSQTTLDICKDYSEYIGKYIFLNGFRIIKNNKNLGFEDLSSGEKFLIVRYISILSGIEKNSIVIVEEPENHLNPKWRELIIPALQRVATAFDSVLIFTTHDYRIIRYLHNDCVLNVTNGLINKIDSPILLCDEYDFESVGEKAISFVYQDLIDAYWSFDRITQAKLINSMCNVEEKMEIRKLYLRKNENN